MAFKTTLLSLFLCIFYNSHSQLVLQNGTTNYVVSFDTSQDGVNEGSYNGSGLSTSPTSGQLNGNAWAISGMSSGTHNFGQTNIANDFARGTSSGGVGTGGLYSFDVGGGNKAIGIQPTGSDWTPGAMCLKIVNNQSSTIQDVDISYNLYIRNDQNRTNSFDFSYSTDNSNFIDVPSASVNSPAGLDNNPIWNSTPVSISINSLALAPGQSLYLKWSGSDQGGSGSRDEFALDDILIETTTSSNNCQEPTVQPTNLTFGNITDNSINASFSSAIADKYLVIQSTSSTFSGNVTDGSIYNIGDILGNGEVIQYDNNLTINATGLEANTNYYFYIFSSNDNCIGGPDYLSISPLSGNASTVQDPNESYYSVVNGQTCEELKTVLYDLIKGHTQYSYSSLWSVYQTTDDRVNDSGNETIVWDMYSDNPSAGENEFTFGSEQCGTYSVEGDCYNREHSFPKSWWGGSTSVAQYTDIFVVVPVDGWINGLRNNNPYGEVQTGGAIQTTNNGSKLGSSSISIPGYTGNVFEPIDEYKGDLARGYFYMITRYENEISSWENSTTESDAVLDGTSYPGLEQWAIDMLIDWHNNDPVSQKEIDRNNEIFSYQQNRNPFIDHPEYVSLIWESCSGGSDTEAPTVPTNLFASNITDSSTELNWNISNDNVGVVSYLIYRDGINVSSTSGTSTVINGLSSQTSYSFYVTALDAAGNESMASNSINITTSNSPDTQAPTIPSNVSVDNVSETTADLSWNASNDNIAVSGYNIYVDGAIIGSTSNTSFFITGLNSSTTYLLNVSAYDAAGNESSLSTTLSITTDSGADTEAPTIPTNFSVSNVTETTADFTWAASNDNIGVVGYKLYQDGVNVSSTSGTSISLSGLMEATTYLFNVSAYDAAGNESGLSSTLSITTDSGSSGPVVLHEGYFESGWDNWQDGGNDASRYSGFRSSEGNYSIRLRDNSGTNSSMTSETFDLTSFTSVEVEFSYYVHSFENVENFILRYFDGSSWVTVKDYIKGTDFNNSTYYTTSVILNNSTYNFASDAQFRFQADASGNNDQVYIDAVIITGNSGNSSLIAKDFMNLSIQGEEEITLNEPILKETEIHLYPNPANDYLIIDLGEQNDGINQISIFNSLGRLVKVNENLNQSKVEIDVRDFDSGIYIIRFESKDKKIESKLFIKK